VKRSPDLAAVACTLDYLAILWNTLLLAFDQDIILLYFYYGVTDALKLRSVLDSYDILLSNFSFFICLAICKHA
jgi:hypothetical protein